MSKKGQARKNTPSHSGDGIHQRHLYRYYLFQSVTYLKEVEARIQIFKQYPEKYQGWVVHGPEFIGMAFRHSEITNLVLEAMMYRDNLLASLEKIFKCYHVLVDKGHCQEDQIMNELSETHLADVQPLRNETYHHVTMGTATDRLSRQQRLMEKLSDILSNAGRFAGYLEQTFPNDLSEISPTELQAQLNITDRSIRRFCHAIRKMRLKQTTMGVKMDLHVTDTELAFYVRVKNIRATHTFPD